MAVGHDVGEHASHHSEKQDGHDNRKHVLLFLLGVRADRGIPDAEPMIVGPGAEDGAEHDEGGHLEEE